MSRPAVSTISRSVLPSLKAESSAIAGQKAQRRFQKFDAEKLPFIPPQSFSTTTSSYPFNSKVVFPPSPTPKPVLPRLYSPRKGWSIIEHLNEAQKAERDPQNLLGTLFSRNDAQRLRTGSIITVTSWNNADKAATTVFSGVLMGIRRRGVDTSFRLRNIINRLGIEIQFKVLSPLIKEIKVVRRAQKGTNKGSVKALRQANAYYLRDRPELLRNLAGALKADRVAAAQQAGRSA